jgi:hypothetical protein
MTFLFAQDEFSFAVRYLGCVPLAIATDEAASQAVDLLFHKLDSIQVRCGYRPSLPTHCPKSEAFNAFICRYYFIPNVSSDDWMGST